MIYKKHLSFFLCFLFSFYLHAAKEEKEGKGKEKEEKREKLRGTDCTNANGEHPLFFAIHEDDFLLFQTLLTDGSDTKKTDADGNTLLHFALLQKKFEFVPLLISHVDLYARNQEGYNALQIAEKLEDKTIFNFLQEHYIPSREIEFFQENPFFEAISSGDYESVRHFLDHGTSPNERDREGQTALRRALQHPRIFLLLYIQEDTDPYAERDSSGNTLLHHAAELSPELLDFLLSQAWDPNSESNMGYTPLHNAARVGNLESYLILLSYGANPLRGGRHTPLRLAVFNDHIDIVNETLHRCLRLSRCNSFMERCFQKLCTQLARVACEKGHLEILILLLDYGANPNPKTERNETLLYLAALYNHNEILHFLVERAGGLHLSANDITERLQTLYRRWKENHSFIWETLDQTQIDYFFREGESSQRPSLEAHRISQEHQLNVADYEYGETPLHRCIIHGNTAGATYLVEMGTDPYGRYLAYRFAGGIGSNSYEEARDRSFHNAGIRRFFSSLPSPHQPRRTRQSHSEQEELFSPSSSSNRLAYNSGSSSSGYLGSMFAYGVVVLSTARRGTGN